LKGAHPGRFRDLASRKNRRLFVVQRGGLDEAAGGSGELDGAAAAQLRRDLTPRHLAASLSDPDEEEREPAHQHVRADAVFEAVEDRTEEERRLEVPKATLCLQEVLVAKGDVFCAQVGLGGLEEVLAVEALLVADLR
jgi:hypothetical protein